MVHRSRHGVRARLARVTLAIATLSLFVACGGGGVGDSRSGGAASAACSVDAQKRWLADYVSSWYYWSAISPQPDPAPFADVDSLFQALLYTGADPRFPADRYSHIQSSEAFDRFYDEGRDLGYGFSVAGLEVAGTRNARLFVRDVEPLSPAAAAGLRRGDRIETINGMPADTLVAASDFSSLAASRDGQVLSLVLDRGGSPSTVTIGAAVYSLTPVGGPRLLATADGRPVGYVAVKSMVSQALPAIDSAFVQFKAAGVRELVLDLRYNGGGLVSAGAKLASYVAGARVDGQTYSRLVYNEAHAARNQTYTFDRPAPALDLSRVYVLAGRRTCSASEQLVSGLRGAGIDVVTIGETSCGKPVGFLPAENCGRTYNVVNFESVNQRGDGRYFDGLAPSCAVAEDFTVAIGSATDPLLAAALGHAERGRCPSTAGAAPMAAGIRDPAIGRGMLAR